MEDATSSVSSPVSLSSLALCKLLSSLLALKPIVSNLQKNPSLITLISSSIKNKNRWRSRLRSSHLIPIRADSRGDPISLHLGKCTLWTNIYSYCQRYHPANCRCLQCSSILGTLVISQTGVLIEIVDRWTEQWLLMKWRKILMKS